MEPSEPVLAGLRAAQERDRREDERAAGACAALPAVTRDGVTHPPARQRGVPRTRRPPRVAVRRRGHRPLPLRVPAGPLRGSGRRRSGRSRSTAGCWSSMRPHPVTVRTWDVGAGRPGPGRPDQPEPGAGERALRLLAPRPRALPRPAPRPAARVGARARCASCSPSWRGPCRPAAGAGPARRGARVACAREGLALRRGRAGGRERSRCRARPDRRPPGAGGGLLQRGDQRPHPVPAGRRPRRPASVGATTSRCTPRCCARSPAIVRPRARPGIPVSMCGEMAADPLHAVVLLGLGVRELSMSPAAIPRVKAALRAAWPRARRARRPRAMPVPADRRARSSAMLRARAGRAAGARRRVRRSME